MNEQVLNYAREHDLSLAYSLVRQGAEVRVHVFCDRKSGDRVIIEQDDVNHQLRICRES